MNSPNDRMHISPLADVGLIVAFDGETEALRYARTLNRALPAWVEDVVPSYRTVGIVLRPGSISIDDAKVWLEGVRPDRLETSVGALHCIPCCYEMQLDMQLVTHATGCTSAEVVALHTSIEYPVYAIGFCPGFPYLGGLPAKLEGVPRLPRPRLQVLPGSVGLAAKQTGIYPLARPGGWNLIGRTPLLLVDEADDYFPIRPGDRLRFTAIDETEYYKREGSRLEVSRS